MSITRNLHGIFMRLQTILATALLTSILSTPAVADFTITRIAESSQDRPEVSKTALSPDRTHLLIKRDNQISVVNLTDGSLRDKTNGTAKHGDTFFQMSADNSTILYSDENDGTIRYSEVSQDAPRSWGGEADDKSFALSPNNDSLAYLQESEAQPVSRLPS